MWFIIYVREIHTCLANRNLMLGRKQQKQQCKQVRDHFMIYDKDHYQDLNIHKRIFKNI